MHELLRFFVDNFGFLYESSDHRITDSSSREPGAAEAKLEVRSADVRWLLVKERLSLMLLVGGTRTGELFGTETIQQYLENLNEPPARHFAAGADGVSWIQQNWRRIEALFADDARTSRTTQQLSQLTQREADRRWGPLPS